MLRVRSLRYQLTTAFLAGMLLVSSTGCVGLTAQALYVFGFDKIQPEFDGLKEKRVAVVCVSGSDISGFGDDARLLSKNIETLMRRNLTDVEFVRQDDIADWMDKNNWNHLDYSQIGRGVEADMVVVVELANLSLHEGPTLLRGRVNATVSVFDITAGGERVFEKDFSEYTYPVNAGVPATDNLGKFRKRFFTNLAGDIGRIFYPHDKIDRFATDVSALGS